MSEEIEPHVSNRFEVVRKIGSGAYGHVWKVVERRTGRVRALKKNFDAFNNSTDAQRTYRQIMFLMQLTHPNVVRLEQVIRAENNRDIYLIFQHMDVDLYTLIREGLLAQRHRKFILYQLAKALYYIHSAGLVHRDVKPSNVLVNQNCEAKLCDFGLVRSIEDPIEPHEQLTEYIATRWYRAPQILLGSRNYTQSIDVWSFGCLLAQMQRGKPLFQGTSTLNQLQKVLMWTGPPTEQQIKGLRLTGGVEVFKLLNKVKKVNRKQLVGNASEQCIDLISHCLQFDPEKRPNLEQILLHPYLSEFYNKIQIGTSLIKIKVPVDDNHRLSLKEYRNIIYEEIKKKNKSSVDLGNSTLYRIKNSVKRHSGKKEGEEQRHQAKQFIVTKVSKEKDSKQVADRVSKEKEKDKQKEREKERQKEREKEKDKQKQKQKQKEKERQKEKEKEKQRVKEKEKEKQRVKEKEKDDFLKKKSFYRGQTRVLVGKGRHLKTIEKEWDPMQSHKLVRHEDEKFLHTKYQHEWARKKRSTTEANTKKPISRIIPSPAELRGRH